MFDWNNGHFIFLIINDKGVWITIIYSNSSDFVKFG